ncbi:hypothetical protein OIK40_15035 [Erythrobacter sp. sf7]|uniref:Uncharacterized protein n=1 Tax=Erythrobacter fulvus TaxID=2987523 RepID=A0ABT5JT68_9SPHN|nr:hypothetical protein [Erythrobacter fulvus]MDC8755960.1 hypothetical protein [Erythrobacter fulvus]
MGRLKKVLCIFGLALGAAAGLAFARFPASSAPLSIQHAEVSRIGKLLADEVTREVSASHLLRASEDADDGWKIILLTSDKDEFTFYSAILIRKQFDDVFDQYVFAFQGTCRVDALNFCARDIVGKVEGPIMQFQNDWKEFSELGARKADRDAAEAAY